MKLDISWHMSITFQASRLHWSNGMAETKLAILAFLYRKEPVKNSIIISVQHVGAIDRALIQASQKPLLSSFLPDVKLYTLTAWSLICTKASHIIVLHRKSPGNMPFWPLQVFCNDTTIDVPPACNLVQSPINICTVGQLNI